MGCSPGIKNSFEAGWLRMVTSIKIKSYSKHFTWEYVANIYLWNKNLILGKKIKTLLHDRFNIDESSIRKIFGGSHAYRKSKGEMKKVLWIDVEGSKKGKHSFGLPFIAETFIIVYTYCVFNLLKHQINISADDVFQKCINILSKLLENNLKDTISIEERINAVERKVNSEFEL